MIRTTGERDTEDTNEVALVEISTFGSLGTFPKTYDAQPVYSYVLGSN